MWAQKSFNRILSRLNVTALAPLRIRTFIARGHLGVVNKSKKFLIASNGRYPETSSPLPA